MANRITILAALILLLLGTNLLTGATYTSLRKSARPYSKHTAHAHTTSAHSRSSRRRARQYNPWHITSYGDPAAEDNPTGEDPAVRAAAVAALGRWNGAVVVADPNNGRILSVVNQKLATEGAFTPCSTFKPIAALAALKEGLITEDTTMRSEPRLRAYGRNFNLTQALAHSSNIYFYKVGQMLGFDRLTEYAHLFGLGEKAAADIPGESAGHFPEAPPKEGGVGMLAYDGLSFDVTPLQMTALVSAIANGGTLYELQYPRTHEELAQFQPKVRRQLDALGPYFPQVRDGMAASVLYGTGRFAYDPQVDIFGKTGTCSENGARLGWFVSYSYSGPQNPKYAMVVLLRGGRNMYGPHAAEIAGKVYHDLAIRDEGRKAIQNLPALTVIGMPSH